MSIPKIQSYLLTDCTSGVKNKADWHLDPSRAVLLIHDMQNYFVDFFDKTAAPMCDVIAQIKSIKSLCKNNGIPVVYTAQPPNQTPEHRRLLTDFWGPGLGGGANKEDITPELPVEKGDINYVKWRYSAFQRTPLLEFMRETGRDQIIICGIYAHIGILATAMDAFMADIQPFIIADAVADFTPEDHAMALTYISGRCGYVISSAQVQKILNKSEVGLTLASMREDIAETLMLSVNDIYVDDNLFDLGLDSIRLMALVEKWRRQGAQLSFADVAEYATLEEWWALIAPKITNSSASEASIHV